MTQQSNNTKSVCVRVGLRCGQHHGRVRKHNNNGGYHRGGVEEHVGVFGVGKKTTKKRTITQQSNNVKSVCTRVGLRCGQYHGKPRKHTNIDGDHRGDVEECVGVFGQGKKRQNHNLHNNQLMQNTFAPELVLDLDSTMTGKGN